MHWAPLAPSWLMHRRSTAMAMTPLGRCQLNSPRLGSLKVSGVGAGLHPQGSAEGGAEMIICEGNPRGMQPGDRASSVSPRYFPRVQTPLIEGGLSYCDHIFCTPRRGKVGGKCAISRRTPSALCTPCTPRPAPPAHEAIHQILHSRCPGSRCSPEHFAPAAPPRRTCRARSPP